MRNGNLSSVTLKSLEQRTLFTLQVKRWFSNGLSTGIIVISFSLSFWGWIMINVFGSIKRRRKNDCNSPDTVDWQWMISLCNRKKTLSIVTLKDQPNVEFLDRIGDSTFDFPKAFTISYNFPDGSFNELHTHAYPSIYACFSE